MSMRNKQNVDGEKRVKEKYDEET